MKYDGVSWPRDPLHTSQPPSRVLNWSAFSQSAYSSWHVVVLFKASGYIPSSPSGVHRNTAA